MPVHPREITPALLQVDAILLRLSGGAAVSEVCRFLRHQVPLYRWVGVYRLDGPMLRLAGWDGEHATEHETIPVGKGVCGRAARENRTVIVGDVTKDPEYLACFLETRSEIVVPIRRDGQVLGEIDVDGNELNVFDGSDAGFLEKVAGKLAPTLGAMAAPSPA